MNLQNFILKYHVPYNLIGVFQENAAFIEYFPEGTLVCFNFQNL